MFTYQQKELEPELGLQLCNTAELLIQKFRSWTLSLCLARKRTGGWDIVVEWVPSPVEGDTKRSRLERGLQIDPFSSFSVAASQLAESGREGGYLSVSRDRSL